MTIRDKIKELFEEKGELTIKEIVNRLGTSKQMAHIVVKELLEEGLLQKLGRAPKTIYRRIDMQPGKVQEKDELYFSTDENNILKEDFLVVTEWGDLLEGESAFDYWCLQRKLPPEKTLQEYKLTKEKYAGYYDEKGLIDGMEKIKNTKGYGMIWLDSLYYLDFYAIERFGKTRLGSLLHYAKQGQSKYLMRIMMQTISKRIKDFLLSVKADAVGFIPPTIRREVQLMKFLQSELNVSLPVIEIKKISGIIPVPQKSLSKLEERIKNAENTFAITDQRFFKQIVLIDDAVGSGATMNEVAGKIKRKGVAENITGLAIVGSFKGFDVITDV
jgi:hypothetical protein